MTLIYLDNNATTKPAPEVIEAMLPYYTDLWANPMSGYAFGNQLEQHLEKARERVAKLIGARRMSEIVFTGSGTEAINSCIFGILQATPQKKHLITTTVEHSAVLKSIDYWKRQGYGVSFLNVDCKGRIIIDELKAALRADTALVSIMWANNETGVIFPIKEFAEICAQKNVPLHVDAVQAIGKISIDLRNIPITCLSLSAHKFHGPKGVGAFYLQRGTKFEPLLHGGSHELSRRAGTHNVAGIVGMGVAAELALSQLSEMPRVKQLRDFFEQELCTIPNVSSNGSIPERLPNTINISVGGVDSASLLLWLSEKGICCSSGSACKTGIIEPSHVLKAMGLEHKQLQGVMRISLSTSNTESEVREAINLISSIISKLRGEKA